MDTTKEIIAENIRLKILLRIVSEYGRDLMTVEDPSAILIGNALVKIASVE